MLFFGECPNENIGTYYLAGKYERGEKYTWEKRKSREGPGKKKGK